MGENGRNIIEDGFME
jgi:hypothetical protein